MRPDSKQNQELVGRKHWIHRKMTAGLLSRYESATICGLMEWAQCPLFSYEQVKCSLGVQSRDLKSSEVESAHLRNY